MNPVLVLTRNCLELTKKCVESVRAQDVPTDIWIIDNGSTDGTVDWAGKENILEVPFPCNVGVSRGWNQGLGCLFDGEKQSHVLVLNNDTQIPPEFYRSLLKVAQHLAEKCLFVSGASVEKLEDAKVVPGQSFNVVPHPDFSAFLITREAWEKVGPFDERMVSYASDNDWHVRAHRAGVKLWNSSIPFYHERSSTLKNASPKERRMIELQADADREVFKEIYGVYPWESGYNELFK